MKPFTFLVSALAATFAVAAPAAAPAPAVEPAATKDVEARSFTFDVNLLNGLRGFQQVNLNYLLNINAVQIHLLQNLAAINNFNVLQFQGLFQSKVFDIQTLLQLQTLHTFLQFHQLGLFNGFDLSTLQLSHLRLGLLQNVGVINLQEFILPNVIPQVQSVASQTLFPPNLNVPVVSTPTSSASVAVPTADSNSSTPGNVVTADEQDAQEGRSSLNN